MVCWDRVETEWPLRLQLPVGTLAPFHATAAGKLYLASLGSDACERLLAEVKLQAYTVHTMVEFRETLAGLADGTFGKTGWTEGRALAECVQAFRDLHAGSVSAAKIILRMWRGSIVIDCSRDGRLCGVHAHPQCEYPQLRHVQQPSIRTRSPMPH